MKKILVWLLVSYLLFSCAKSRNAGVEELVKVWSGKEIFFPKEIVFTKFGTDTVDYAALKSRYRIVTYIDSIGCVSCKLQLVRWKKMIAEFDSITNCSVPILFFVHPKGKKEMSFILKRDKFDHPICMDLSDSFNKLNKFPPEVMFQTFLIDGYNKVIGIGNPVHNYRIKEIYLKIIQEKEMLTQKNNIQTDVRSNRTTVDMGKFDWQKIQEKVFVLTNIGNNPLVITDVVTSCGCISVEYNKEPVYSSDSIELRVSYRSNHPEHFKKKIIVHCNTSSSPIVLTVTGRAEDIGN